MTEQELVGFIHAHMDGEKIQQQSAIGWINFSGRWDSNAMYRAKPEPFECWCNVYIEAFHSYSSRAAAVDSAHSSAIKIAVHMVEKE